MAVTPPCAMASSSFRSRVTRTRPESRGKRPPFTANSSADGAARAGEYVPHRPEHPLLYQLVEATIRRSSNTWRRMCGVSSKTISSAAVGARLLKCSVCGLLDSRIGASNVFRRPIKATLYPRRRSTRRRCAAARHPKPGANSQIAAGTGTAAGTNDWE